jgi:4-azaleucine resistance transporter AzlC
MTGLLFHLAGTVVGSVTDADRRGEGRPQAGRRAPRHKPAAIPTPRSGGAGFGEGMRLILPLLPAVLALGASFGVLASAAGIGPAASLVMSATTFAGSAQMAIVSVLGAGGTALAAIGAAVLLNARYGPMALAARGAFTGSPLRRLVESQLLVDESWALANRDGHFDRRVLLGAGALIYIGWNAGTAVGVVAGEGLGDPATIGLDAAFPALFLALLAPQLHTRNAVAAALGGAVIALVLIPVAPVGLPVIAATLACLVGLRQDGRDRHEPRTERSKRRPRTEPEAAA